MSDVETTPAGVQAIIDAAREHATPVVVDPTKLEQRIFVVPKGSTLEYSFPSDEYLERPRRLTGAVSVEDVASFKAYVATFYDPASTTAWVDQHRHRVVAVLNDAAASESAWRDHRATLQLVKTPEWKRWREKDGVLMDQEAFARHIELAELDIVDPDAATLLEIAQTFWASTKAEFRSGTRLQSGEVQFEWVEETQATAGRNRDLTIPAKFELRLSPFHGEDVVAVTALLRYRVRNGELRIGYELVRPDDVERDAMELIAESLRNEIDRVYLGSPAG
jgi:uncharacterized protein YfdQ (DUF2303 family)